MKAFSRGAHADPAPSSPSMSPVLPCDEPSPVTPVGPGPQGALSASCSSATRLPHAAAPEYRCLGIYDQETLKSADGFESRKFKVEGL